MTDTNTKEIEIQDSSNEDNSSDEVKNGIEQLANDMVEDGMTSSSYKIEINGKTHNVNVSITEEIKEN